MSTTVNLYPDELFESPPDEFDETILKAVELIESAVKGWGTDDALLVSSLATKSPLERFLISLSYESQNGKKLLHRLSKELGSGDFGLALKLLGAPSDVSEAVMVKKCLSGMGTKEDKLYPILCGRSNKEMDKLKEAYFAEYDQDLSVRLNDELGGDFEKFVFHCLQGKEEEYDPDFHTPEKAETDADQFYEAGRGSWGTDEKGLFELITKCPPEHLANVNTTYETKYVKPLLDDLKKELGGDTEDACLYAMGMKLEPAKTVARLVKKYCKGMGTDEMGLTFTLIRYQSMMKEVDDAHKELYDGMSLAERVDDECRGKFQDLLLKVVETGLAA